MSELLKKLCTGGSCLNDAGQEGFSRLNDALADLTCDVPNAADLLQGVRDRMAARDGVISS